MSGDQILLEQMLQVCVNKRENKTTVELFQSDVDVRFKERRSPGTTLMSHCEL